MANYGTLMSVGTESADGFQVSPPLFILERIHVLISIGVRGRLNSRSSMTGGMSGCRAICDYLIHATHATWDFGSSTRDGLPLGIRASLTVPNSLSLLTVDKVSPKQKAANLKPPVSAWTTSSLSWQQMKQRTGVLSIIAPWGPGVFIEWPA